MIDKPIPDDLKSNHLFLLVGKNPLPNLIAARLLGLPESPMTIFLLCSNGADGEPSTKPLAENLEIVLKEYRADLCVQIEPIASSDPQEIGAQITQILKRCPANARIGLNYTGGTKPMSLHTYRAIQAARPPLVNFPVFSYLDPRTLALRFDRGSATTSAEIFFPILEEPALREKVTLSLDQLAALHGYERKAWSPTWNTATEVPSLANLASTIKDIHKTQKGFTQWRAWTRTNCITALPNLKQYSALHPLVVELEGECGSPVRNEQIVALLRANKPAAPLKSCSTWFRGVWLEEYAANCLGEISERYHLKIERNLHFEATPARVDSDKRLDKFELDIVATLGYQLFLVSCIATDVKTRSKEHLLEAYVRARQLGGDEARVGLVCCSRKRQELEGEIRASWDAEGQFRVFGRDELENLTGEFEKWISDASSLKGDT